MTSSVHSLPFCFYTLKSVVDEALCEAVLYGPCDYVHSVFCMQAMEKYKMLLLYTARNLFVHATITYSFITLGRLYASFCSIKTRMLHDCHWLTECVDIIDYCSILSSIPYISVLLPKTLSPLSASNRSTRLWRRRLMDAELTSGSPVRQASD